MPNLELFKQVQETAEFNIDLLSMQETYIEIKNAREECGGNVTYRAKIAAGGVKQFNIETGDDEMNASVPSITGVIIRNYACNAYFDEESEGNSPPICSSDDAKTGVIRDTGELQHCASCKHNAFGSSAKGGGKACKNMHILYMLVEGCPIPLRISLPPTSLKSWQTYRTSTLAMRKLKPHEAVTEISIEIKGDKNKYGVAKFALKGKLPDNMKAVAQIMANEANADKTEITGDDYNRLAATASGGSGGKPEDIGSAEQ